MYSYRHGSHIVEHYYSGMGQTNELYVARFLSFGGYCGCVFDVGKERNLTVKH